MSTPVYPLVFRNPVSDGESSGNCGAGTSNRKLTLGSSPSWCESTCTSEHKFHKALTDMHKVMVSSPASGASSRREGFRWSNGSSYDSGMNHIEGDVIEFMEQNNFENPRSPNSSTNNKKCGLCCRLLSQKSPWSSQRIVRSSDLPVTGILPCGHIFHADCLEETTPKSQVQEPPCPLCLNLIKPEESTSFSEPLLFALRTQGGDRGIGSTSNHAGSNSNQNDCELRRNQSQPLRGSSSMKSRLRKRLSFKGKMSRDLLGAKLFRKSG
ncbi:hypothetical protein HPP92_001713 [Vanilla planifolia]|uniref:RING-type domain-containing protein n=1 Tax=Vanilla planifolia TaxID=51239 RepID=A0A835S3W1_VANPL|nr:hypothetical protein HPP92_001713 [Vanilla planifolia]